MNGVVTLRIKEKRLVETDVDRVCDVCDKSVFITINNDQFEECAELSATWGYGSKQDGKVFHLDLCESCFGHALAVLREKRRAVLEQNGTAFDETEFGLDLTRTFNG